jgi:hypothetical protein
MNANIIFQFKGNLLGRKLVEVGFAELDFPCREVYSIPNNMVYQYHEEDWKSIEY